MFGSGEVWGIALGGTELRAVKLARNGDQVILLEVEVMPYPVAGAEEGVDRDLLTRQALQALVAKHQIRSEAVAISVPGHAVFSKFISLPPVERKRIPEIVKYESRQQIPFPIEEVVWDYQPVRSDLVPGEDIEVALFAIRREIIQGYLATCQGAGLKPQVVQAAPLALCNFLRFDRSAEGPLVVLDVANDSTELLIIDEERCWPRSLAVGSQDLTAALQKKFQISLEKAEELKAQAAKSKQADRLFGVMKPVLQNLAGQVQRTLGFYKSQHPEVRFSKVVLVGDFFALPGIEAFFKESLKYEFVRLGASKRIQLEDGVDRGTYEAAAPCLGTALGLGIQALGLASMKINLVPPEHAQVRQQAAKRPWVAAGALLACAAVGAEWWKVDSDGKALVSAQDAVAAEIRRMDDLKDDLKKASQKPAPFLEALAQIPALLKDRETGLPAEVYSDILRKVVEAVPRDQIWIQGLLVQPVKLSSLALEPEPPAWAKGKDKEQRATLKIRFEGQKAASGAGRSVDGEFVQENFIAKMASVPYFDKFVSDGDLKNEDDGPKYDFNVEWVLNPDAYLNPPKGAEAGK